MSEYPIAKPVTINYKDLSDDSKDLSKEIEEAFGFSGLGLIVIQDVPKFPELRQRLLPLSSKYASLSDEIKSKTVHKESHFSFGWSHGKEKLKRGEFGTTLLSYLLFILFKGDFMINMFLERVTFFS
eukprot:TRINITY_DN1915_c0_g1_i3.p1 TRINITY_DN1915_c0_g1~~TRINITY_DN1915_c0_g1_i3.p1  ORF type:complete len:127 (-),score=17.97 TRINITY_DN1915_c0_g1_i3:124-504(-)